MRQEESYNPLGEAAATSESSLVDSESLILLTAIGRFRGRVSRNHGEAFESTRADHPWRGLIKHDHVR